MRNALFVVVAACAPAWAAVQMGDSPAADQARSLNHLTSDYVYDKSVAPQGRPAVLADASGVPDDKCPAGGCTLRKGPVFRDDLPEPRNPIRAIEQDEADKKGGGLMSWLKSPLVMVGGGAVLGGLVGYFAKGTILGFALKGGLMGGLIGAVIGAAIGFAISKFF